MKTPITVILALVLFALPAAFAAMWTFERLHIIQVDRYQAMTANLGPYGARAIPPAEIARYAYRLKYTGYPRHPGGVIFHSRIPWTARKHLPIIAAFLPGTLVAGVLLWLLSYRPQILPLAASRGERFWAVCSAMRAAWPWSMAAAVLVAAIVWYIGFDRDGTTGSLEQRLTPRRMQLACLVAGWCVLSVAGCAALLPRSLTRGIRWGLAERLLCQRCGYSLIGLDGRNCPECGRPGTSVLGLDKQPRAWAGRAARMFPLIAVVVAALLVGAAAVNSRARDWLLLRPPRLPAANIVGWLALGEAPQIWRSEVGVVRVSATLPERSDGRESAWTIAWTFEPGMNFKQAARRGMFRIPITHGTPRQPDLHWRELPCGPIAFHSLPNDSRLHVLSPHIIFYDLGNSARPIPPP